MPQCPVCDSDYDVGDAMCDECGTKVGKICEKCGGF
jgi:predicted amidophosphoribosyltransferase